ncbi:MAG: LAGLIDADG family homing endonuclease [bacterium]|nr:LAGLIDADG family homing endonuclease [bacterium]
MAPMFRGVNQDFFKRWSSEMAYVLGFFAADGNMIRNKRGAHFIAFYSNDRGLLEKVRATLVSDHKIGKRVYKSSKKSTTYQLQL